MTKPEQVEITGTIKYLAWQHHGDNRVEFSVLDSHGRLLFIKYCYTTGAGPIHDSLKKGMNVKLLIEGPVTDDKAAYKGVGFIRVLNQ